MSGAEAWVPERPSLTSVRAGLEECRGCDLWQHATQAVPGDGRRTAPLMLVGEQPGDREDLAGKPFVGPAGQLLDRALSEAGIAPDQVFRTNAVKHFRFSEVRGKRRIHQAPAARHIHACRPWLIAELDMVRPRGVVLLGATAAASVHGASFRLTTHRAELLDWPADVALARPPAWVMATVHPSSVLRSRNRTEDLASLVRDLRVAAEAL